MIRLLKFLITGSWHVHSWETLHGVEVYRENSEGEGLPKGHKYILRCKECGEITYRKTY